MNRNVKFEKARTPTPPPPPPRIPTPPPPTPPPPPKRFIPWVPYDKAKVKETKIVKSKLDFPFDLYIDAVRFVPDNATFIKVTIFVFLFSDLMQRFSTFFLPWCTFNDLKIWRHTDNEINSN